jgi:hypothetical protein
MEKERKTLQPYEMQISLKEFLAAYNKNAPADFPKVSEEQLKRFKSEHASFFKDGVHWSLDRHRKRVMDWLPRNEVAS